MQASKQAASKRLADWMCVAVPQVCKYIDIPLQHISNLTLLSMNR